MSSRWHYKPILLNAVALPIMACIYWKVTSRGVRILSVANFAQRIVKGVDIANLIGLGLLFFTWVFCHLAFKILLYPDPARSSRGLNFESNRIVVLSIAALLVVFDAAMFFVGSRAESEWGGGGGTSTLKALIATVLYITPVIGLAYYATYVARD